MKFFSFFFSLVFFFFLSGMNFSAIAQEKLDPANIILDQINRALNTTGTAAVSGDISAGDIYKQLAGKDENAKRCFYQLIYEGEAVVKEFLDLRNWLYSVEDIFTRNQCLRTDIQNIEAGLERLSQKMDQIALDCSETASKSMQTLIQQYRLTQLELRLLRKFGSTPVPNGMTEKDRILQELSRPEYEKIVTGNEIKSDIAEIPYFQAKYLDFHPENNPEGCKDTVFTDLFGGVGKRLEELKGKLKSFGEETSGLFTFSPEEKAKREANARRKAKQWLDNFNFGIFRVGGVSELQDQKLLEKEGLWGRISHALDGVYKLGNELHIEFIPPTKSLESILAEAEGQTQLYDTYATLKDTQRVDKRKQEIQKLRGRYIQAFRENAASISQDLENQLIVADQCVRASFIEGEDTLIAGCGAEGKLSLPTFEQALQNMLSHQCTIGTGSSQCILPASLLNKLRP